MVDSPREATAVELAALLMDIVVRSTPPEEEAVRRLGELAQTDAGRMRSELLFLRDFAVGLALEVELGGDERQAEVVAHYSRHWSGLDAEVAGASAERAQRTAAYAAAAHDPASRAALPERAGRTYASLCGVAAASASSEVARFGGALFSCLYEEVCRLLDEVTIRPADAPAAGTVD